MTAVQPMLEPGETIPVPKIYAALVRVMTDVGVVGKEGFNKHDRYDFRRAEDVLNALHPALVKHGVLLIPETTQCEQHPYASKKGVPMNRSIVQVVHRFICSDDGSTVDVTTYGEGSDIGDKSVNKAHTAALKTALCTALCIPTELLADSETDSPDERHGQVPDDETGEGAATTADLDRIQDALAKRCEDLKLDPDSYSPVIIADVLEDTNWDWNSVPDIPRKEIGWICSSISIWEERDSAPQFNDDEPPHPADAPQP